MAVSSPLQPDPPALPGGRRPIPFIDLAAQQARIRTEIERAIIRVLDHGQYIMGPEVAELEAGLAAFAGSRHAITCASGTDALLIALMAKNIGPGDAVLCPAFTFTATPETIALLGATPVFVDVTADTFNIDPQALDAGLATVRREGLKPAALIAVDLFGLPANYDEINSFAGAHGLCVVADAAQSFGACYNGRRVGALAHVTATSFFPAKPLGCYGDGGALFTDDDALASVMRSIRLHGQGIGKYEIARIGVNGRLDTIQAAILIEKLKIFPDELSRRETVARRYAEALADVAARPSIPVGSKSAWAQYTVRLPAERRSAIVEALATAGIPTQVYYPRPVPHQRAYQGYPVADNGVPTAERLAQEVLSLPMHPYLNEDDQQYIIAQLRALV